MIRMLRSPGEGRLFVCVCVGGGGGGEGTTFGTFAHRCYGVQWCP